MTWVDILSITVILLCLVFTFSNGFQDGSSVAAAAMMSRSLRIRWVLLIITTFEFLGALLGGSAVAGTIQSITNLAINPSILPVLISGLVAAITWNLITRILKLPSSSTHALIGGIIGATVAHTGNFNKLVMGHMEIHSGVLYCLSHTTGIVRVIVALFLSPLMGYYVGFLIFNIFVLLLKNATTVINKPIKFLQLPAIAALAFSHGANDTQKAMGVAALALQASAFSSGPSIPFWLRVLTGLAMVAGIMSFAPGIVKKVGSGIYRLRPLHALTAEVSASIVLCVASATGGPVSATQVISSSILGIGSAERFKGVHWLVAKDMFAAWFLTIPSAACLAWILHQNIFRMLPVI